MIQRMIKQGMVCGTLLMSVLLVRASINAQTPIVLNTNPPPMAPQRTSVKTSGTATAGYEKFNDITYSSSAPIALNLPDSGWGSLNAGFTSKGNGVVKPSHIVLRIFTATKDRSYVDKPDAKVFADDKKVFDGKAEIKDARTNGSEVYASFEITVSLDEFIAITKAEKFGIAVGPSGWFIPKTELSKFNDLLGIY